MHPSEKEVRQEHQKACVEEQGAPGPLKHKKEWGWMQGGVVWEENREIVPAARDEVRKAKSLRKLNLARDIKGNNKTFWSLVGDIRKTRKNVGPLKKEMRVLVTWGMKKTGVLKDFRFKSSSASAPSTSPNSLKVKAGSEKIKNCQLQEKIRFKN